MYFKARPGSGGVRPLPDQMCISAVSPRGAASRTHGVSAVPPAGARTGVFCRCPLKIRAATVPAVACCLFRL